MARILVVDDDPFVRRALRRMLEAGGYEVTDVPGGPDALRVMSETAFDLIITDLNMPQVDGLELADLIGRLMPPRPKVIVATATMEDADRVTRARDANDVGLAGTLSKPFTREELTRVINTALWGDPSLGMPPERSESG